MLHLVFQSPIELAILQRVKPDDVVVFLENSVLRILKQGALQPVLLPLIQTNRLCVMSDDIVVRGISVDELVLGIDVIDFDELVALTIQNAVIQSWT
ncbi:MAG: DsrH/TusB family sulfur metabolism protein [Methylococcales bacterium]|nr:sulfurtransferase TusB [Methylococcaceae bacterium]